jgi:hypothetical protein
LKLAVSEVKKASAPKATARPCNVRDDELFIPKAPKPDHHYRKAYKRRKPQPSPCLEVRRAPLHPSFKRVVASICPFSGLSRRELEEHVAGILAMVDEADRREVKA